MNLIAAFPAHAAALASVHAAAFPPGEAWQARDFATQLGLPGTFGFLDPTGGMVLARAAAEEAEILMLGVAPAARRRGIAVALMRAAMDEAARRGARAMFLEMAEANAPAGALYAKLGFASVGRRRCYYANGTDALTLRAPLGAPGGDPGGL